MERVTYGFEQKLLEQLEEGSDLTCSVFIHKSFLDHQHLKAISFTN